MAAQKLPSPLPPLVSIALSLLVIPATLPVRPPDHEDRLSVLELLSPRPPFTRHMPFAFLKAAASSLNCASIPWLPPPLHAPAHSHFPERPLQPGPTTARSPTAPRATSSNEHLFTPFLPVSLHCRPAKARTGHGHRQQLAHPTSQEATGYRLTTPTAGQSGCYQHVFLFQ